MEDEEKLEVGDKKEKEGRGRVRRKITKRKGKCKGKRESGRRGGFQIEEERRGRR